MKNYFIIHDYFLSPQDNWYGWLAEKIRRSGRNVYAPDFLSTSGYPYRDWSALLKYYVNSGVINRDTTIIAHSLSAIFICKYIVLNKLSISKLVLVSGFNNYLTSDETVNAIYESMYFSSYIKTREYVKHILCIYSDDDKCVPPEYLINFAGNLATKRILIKNAGHFDAKSGYTTFYQMLNFLDLKNLQ